MSRPVLRVLPVDDDHDTGRNFADLFGDCGRRVDTAESGDIPLEPARNQCSDPVRLDSRITGMDRLTLCERLKKLQTPLAQIPAAANARTNEVATQNDSIRASHAVESAHVNTQSQGGRRALRNQLQ